MGIRGWARAKVRAMRLRNYSPQLAGIHLTLKHAVPCKKCLPQ